MVRFYLSVYCLITLGSFCSRPISIRSSNFVDEDYKETTSCSTSVQRSQILYALDWLLRLRWRTPSDWLPSIFHCWKTSRYMGSVTVMEVPAFVPIWFGVSLARLVGRMECWRCQLSVPDMRRSRPLPTVDNLTRHCLRHCQTLNAHQKSAAWYYIMPLPCLPHL